MPRNNISPVEHAVNQELVYQVNVEKGWYDKPVLFLEAMMLLVTEVVEANDAYYQEGLLGGWKAQEHLSSEFADCYIRLVDDASRCMIDFGVAVETHRHAYQRVKAYSFDGLCMQLIRRVRDAVEAYRREGLDPGTKAGPEVSECLVLFFLQLQDACDELGIDLMKAFAVKVEVNRNRPYRHGNKHA